MNSAVVVHGYGGPEMLSAESIDVGRPGKGEIRLRHTCIGVNFHDVYVRAGLYKTLSLPGIPGIEAVGRIEELGSGVSGFSVGDRVAYITSGYGCYASARLLPSSWAVKLPDIIEDRTAASVFLKGLTVEMLVRQVYQIKPGDWVLVQAAAGAVGQLLVQWAARLGAQVIGTAGTPEKAALAQKAGCSFVILYREENVVEQVRMITVGRGVDVAYDSVGKDTFDGSLDSLALCAHVVNFGQASGPVQPVALTRPRPSAASLRAIHAPI